MMILGVQLIMTGLLGEVVSRIYFKTHDKKIYSVEAVKSRSDAEEEIPNNP
jgi:hypothetical protein